MYGMMNNTGWAFGFVFLGVLHVLSVIIFAVGVLFLILWAIKTLTAAELKTWGIRMVVIGIVLSLFTIAAAPFSHRWGGRGFNQSGKMMEGGMMDRFGDSL